MNWTVIPRASSLNGTTAALASSATYTGTWEDVSHYSTLVISVRTDQAGTLFCDFSPDGTNSDSTLTFSISSTVGELHRLSISRKWFRIRITNTSASPQTYCRAQVLLGVSTPLLTSPLNSTVQQDSDAIIVRAVDFEFDVAASRAQGMSIVNKFGRNTDVDSGTVPEDIWEGGGVYTGWATAAETLQVFSSSAADASAGTGARTLRIMGLDANYVAQNETVTLNGTTPVTTTNTFIRVHSASVQSAGSGGVNAGTLTVRQSTTTTNIFLLLQIGVNQSNSSAYTIPAGQTGYMRKLHGSIRGGTSSALDAGIWTRSFGGVFRQRRPFVIAYGTQFIDEIYGGLVFTEKSDIILRITASNGNNLDVVGGYDLLLVDN